jgi:hypothetical protein
MPSAFFAPSLEIGTQRRKDAKTPSIETTVLIASKESFDYDRKKILPFRFYYRNHPIFPLGLYHRFGGQPCAAIERRI